MKASQGFLKAKAWIFFNGHGSLPDLSPTEHAFQFLQAGMSMNKQQLKVTTEKVWQSLSREKFVDAHGLQIRQSLTAKDFHPSI